MKINLVLLLMIFFTSCVSLKPAKNIDQAEVKIRKFNTGIQNQIERFPSIADIAYKIIIKDTIYIPSASTEFSADLISKDSLNKVKQDYNKLLNDKQASIDSLLNKPLPTEDKEAVIELKRRLNLLSKEYQEQKEQSLYYLERYNSLLFKSVSGTYEDSLFVVNYFYRDGSITIQPSVKDRFIIRDKTQIGYDINIRRHFWQDIKFWGFLILLLNLFYFFNSLIYNLLNSIFTGIKKFVMKLFTKV